MTITDVAWTRDQHGKPVLELKLDGHPLHIRSSQLTALTERGIVDGVVFLRPERGNQLPNAYITSDHAPRSTTRIMETAMLMVRICDADGALIAEGTCSDSGYFPLVLSSMYNAALKLEPARNLEHFGSPSGSADYPVGTGRATFGYSLSGRAGSGRILDAEVVVHVERT